MKTEKNIFIAFILNLIFSLIELIGGLFTGSIAILSDSVHDFGDSLSIGLSFILERKSKQKANYKYTYGYVKYSVMGSIITTLILIIGSIFVIIEAIKRIINPIALNYNGMILIALFGVIVNLIASYCTKDHHSLNEKSVNLHMLEDVLGWVVVLIGSILIKFTNITIIDALLSIMVALFILFSALNNFKEILNIFLEKTPNDINIKTLKKDLLNIKGVIDVHHIHVRSIDGINNYATMHIVVKKYDSKLKLIIKNKLKELNINHSTIEFEEEKENCDNKECY